MRFGNLFGIFTSGSLTSALLDLKVPTMPSRPPSIFCRRKTWKTTISDLSRATKAMQLGILLRSSDDRVVRAVSGHVRGDNKFHQSEKNPMVSARSKRFRGVREQLKNGIFGVLPEGGGWGRRKKKTLASKALDFENSVRQQTGLMIGWASGTLLTCVDQRS